MTSASAGAEAAGVADLPWKARAAPERASTRRETGRSFIGRIGMVGWGRGLARVRVGPRARDTPYRNRTARPVERALARVGFTEGRALYSPASAPNLGCPTQGPSPDRARASIRTPFLHPAQLPPLSDRPM